MKYKIEVKPYGVFEGNAPVVSKYKGGVVVRLKKDAGPYRAGNEIRIDDNEIVKPAKKKPVDKK